VLMNYLVTQIY